jgi:hypothetical protein
MGEGASRVLPVGLPGGVVNEGGASERADGWIRRGPDFHVIPAAAYRMWQASAAGPTPAELVANGRALGVPDPRATCKELAAEDLLVVLSEDPERRRAVFARHGLHLLMPGLGSIGDGQLGMGHDLRAPWVSMDLLTYGILLASNNGRPIWDVCVVAAEEASAPVDQVAAGLAAQLPQLMSAGVVALDAP